MLSIIIIISASDGNVHVKQIVAYRYLPNVAAEKVGGAVSSQCSARIKIVS